MFRDKFPVPQEWADRAWLDNSAYKDMYESSVTEKEEFWAEQGMKCLAI